MPWLAFISGRSTVLQLITILDTRTYQIDRGHHTYVIYMDFKKIFDTVPHKRLISKLNSLNISKEIVNWIEAFISNRRQKVAVNGKESNWHDVTSGKPQGTVLGPLLFVLYINVFLQMFMLDEHVQTHARTNAYMHAHKRTL